LAGGDGAGIDGASTEGAVSGLPGSLPLTHTPSPRAPRTAMALRKNRKILSRLSKKSPMRFKNSNDAPG
jgi:hypothetical protein